MNDRASLYDHLAVAVDSHPRPPDPPGSPGTIYTEAVETVDDQASVRRGGLAPL